jgi:hypothetical protein
MKWFLLASVALIYSNSPLSVHLNNPEYSDGVIQTEEGGVVKAEGIRIQALSIHYVKKEDSRHVVAEGDLSLEYGGRIFVGSRLEYDFIACKGTLYGGITEIDGWFLGGEKITLMPDKSFYIYDAYVTTSTDKEREWDIYGSRIKVEENGKIESRGAQIRFMKMPIFWIPGFHANLHNLPDHPVRYSVNWDKGQGPQFSMKYKLYSWERASITGRFDYRWKRGPGGALGCKYISEDHLTKLQSDNYYAYDTFYNDNNPNKRRKRFRLQGKYNTESPSGNTSLNLAYDRISDKNMPSDFHMDNFELNNARQTQATLSHHQDYYLAEVNVRPRINNFQGFKQEIPAITFNPLPINLPKTGMLMENRLRLSYLDYVYSNDIKGMIPDFSAFRGEYTNKLYRSFQSGPAIFTPFVGFTGIYYSDSPIDRSISQAIFEYGAHLQSNLSRDYDTFSHTLIPYAEYTGLSGPTHPEDEYYIFGIQDGFHRLNNLRLGARNDIYLNTANPFTPTFTSDLYLLGFFGDTTFAKTFPKLNLNFTYNLQNLAIKSRLGWNTENKVFDFANIGLEWTLNSDYAFSAELLHRSRFYWRKDDYNNFILDVTRTVTELLDSPLSDGRNTLLVKAQFKIAPQWFARIQTHSGWGRGAREKGYTEAKVDLYTMITSSWRMRLSYMHTVRDDQVSVSFNLVK